MKILLLNYPQILETHTLVVVHAVKKIATNQENTHLPQNHSLAEKHEKISLKNYPLYSSILVCTQ